MKFYIIITLIFILLPHLSLAEETTIDYETRFLGIEKIMLEMSNDGFQIQRMNDTLKAAKQIYEGQMNIKTASLRDFSLIDSYLLEIENLKTQGYTTKDEIAYVYDIYNQIKSENPEINLEEAKLIIDEMQFEFDSERYEESYDLAKEAYSKLIEIEGEYTALNLAYKTTTQTLKSFFINNWLIISIVSVSAFFLYLILKNRLRIILIKHRIKRLTEESASLEDLIRNAQTEYFEKAKMSEATYRIRIKKFSELMRDINRQIPLLKEELARRKKSATFESTQLNVGVGKKVEKVRYGEVRVNSENQKNKKDKGIKAPIKERKVQYITKTKKTPVKTTKKKKR